jgi:hypothetical protein
MIEEAKRRGYVKYMLRYDDNIKKDINASIWIGKPESVWLRTGPS